MKIIPESGIKVNDVHADAQILIAKYHRYCKFAQCTTY